jgi:transposase-like protein
MAKWQVYDVAFKRRVVARMEKCDNVAALAQELNLHRSVLYIWRLNWKATPEPGART